MPIISGGSAGSGSGSSNNESLAGALTNAISPGDAGSRSDQFLGTALGTSWGNLYGVGVAATVKSSMVSFTNSSGVNVNTGARIPYTPSGAFRLEARLRNGMVGSGVAIEVTDSLNLATENTMGVGFLGSVATTVTVYSRDAGAFTNRGSGNMLAAFEWVYVALARDGANNWTAQYSIDRATWLAVGTFAKTFTAAFIKIDRFTNGTQVGGFDFIDVVS